MVTIFHESTKGQHQAQPQVWGFNRSPGADIVGPVFLYPVIRRIEPRLQESVVNCAPPAHAQAICVAMALRVVTLETNVLRNTGCSRNVCPRT